MRILVVGLNPALQKILSFDTLRKGEVNRAVGLTSLPSGKGMNAARLLARWGHEVELLQILGIDNAEIFDAECKHHRIGNLGVCVPGQTRTCITLLEENLPATELIEPFSVPFGTDQRVLDAVAELGTVDALMICGTAPNGCGSDLYTRIAESVRTSVLFLDSYRDLPESLLAEADVLKINQEEMQELLVKFPNILDAPKPSFCITRGAQSASLHCWRNGGKVVREISIPVIQRVANPIGAGDTVSAGLLNFILLGRGVDEAFMRGLALGSASCLQVLPAHFKEQEAVEVWDRILHLNKMEQSPW